METTRQKKVATLIQREMSIIFQNKSIDFMKKMVSVTVVRMSPDLGNAKVFLSIFPDEGKQEVLKLIIESTKTLRYELGTRIKNQVRIIPEIQFYIDDSLDYAAKIDDLLKK